jgi:hypothetical protein
MSNFILEATALGTQQVNRSDYLPAQPISKFLTGNRSTMKPLHHFIFLVLVIFCLVTLSTSAQQMQMPGDYRVPVQRLMASPSRVRAENYSQKHAETTVDFTGTALMPKAHGTAKVETGSGVLNVELHVQGLGPASQIDPAYLTYVLWAVPANQNKPQNLGELVLDGNESTIKASTNLAIFAMIVSAEPYFAVKQPSALIVLQNTFRVRSDDPDVLRADLLPLRADAKTPLDIYEARNAVRIARLAGAERYAAEPFHKALQLLQQAESIFAHKKSRDIPDVKEKAREATEAAEDARAVAIARAQESNPLRPQDTP